MEGARRENQVTDGRERTTHEAKEMVNNIRQADKQNQHPIKRQMKGGEGGGSGRSLKSTAVPFSMMRRLRPCTFQGLDKIYRGSRLRLSALPMGVTLSPTQTSI